MKYKWHGKEISFNLIWKGSNAMFNDMDGVKALTDEDEMLGIPKYATVFMFKVKDGYCYLGVPYDENYIRVNKFTHIGWKTFLSEEERNNAFENNKWMYRVWPGHPGNKYFYKSLST